MDILLFLIFHCQNTHQNSSVLDGGDTETKTGDFTCSAVAQAEKEEASA